MERDVSRLDRIGWAWLTLAGLAALVVPLITDMFNQFWFAGENTQAPIIMVAVAYGYWLHRNVFHTSATTIERRIGAFSILLAWIAFACGRGAGFYQLEAVALPLVVAGLTLSVGGAATLRHLAMLPLLLVFTVPLPGSIADSLLVPLKSIISHLVVSLLATLNYPIGVDGVVISIGFTQLQIADACSGLWSLVSLVAIGCVYEFFLGSSRQRVAILFISLVVPIAILTNFLRVLMLVLVAYHFGALGEASVHDIAAWFEVVLSLGLFAACHRMLEHLFGVVPSSKTTL